MASRSQLRDLVQNNLIVSSPITALNHSNLEYTIVDSLAPYNRGFVAIGDLPITVMSYSGGGDLTTASCASVATGILVTLPNALPSINYLVRFHIQSFGTLSSDSSLGIPAFSIVSTTQFRFSLTEISGVAQNIRVWFETISLD